MARVSTPVPSETIDRESAGMPSSRPALGSIGGGMSALVAAEGPPGREKGTETAGIGCDELSLCWASDRPPAGLSRGTTA